MGKVITRIFEKEVATDVWVHCLLKVNPETYSGHLNVSYSGARFDPVSMSGYNTEVFGSSIEEAVLRVNAQIKMDIRQKVGAAFEGEPFKV